MVTPAPEGEGEARGECVNGTEGVLEPGVLGAGEGLAVSAESQPHVKEKTSFVTGLVSRSPSPSRSPAERLCFTCHRRS